MAYVTTVVTCGLGPGALRHLVAELGASTRALEVRRVEELKDIVQNARASIVLCDAAKADLEWSLTASLLFALVDTMRHMQVIARLPQPIKGAPLILQITHDGVRPLQSPIKDPMVAALLNVFAADSQNALIASLLNVLRPFLPDQAMELIRRCLPHVRQPISVQHLASELGMSRRTLGRHCISAQLPQPEELIASCRLMLVWHRVRMAGESLEDVALEYGFAGASDVRTRIKRHTGLTLDQIRSRGGLALVFVESYGTISAILPSSHDQIRSHPIPHDRVSWPHSS